MGETTKIEWCDATFNPWWGCQRVSPGCEHCYAEAFDRRVGGEHWGATSERRFFGEKHWAEPRKWNKEAEEEGVRRRVFCASMADVFEDRPELEKERIKLWGLIHETPWLDWLLLTKRPENIGAMKPSRWIYETAHNVWLGCTAEDQQRLNERLPHLVEQDAGVGALFLSCEPLLERLNLPPVPGIDWVIIGGESGGGARRFDLSWARDLVEQCSARDIACFVKQLGARPAAETVTDCATIEAMLDRRKGGDWDEWPEELRVREFPEARHAR